MNGNYVISVYCLIYVLHLHYTKPNWRTPKSVSRTRFNIYSQTTTPNPWFRPSIPGFLGHFRNNMTSKLPAFVSHSCLLLSTRNSFMSFLTMNRIWWQDRHEPGISEHALTSMQLAHSRIRTVGQRRQKIERLSEKNDEYLAHHLKYVLCSLHIKKLEWNDSGPRKRPNRAA